MEMEAHRPTDSPDFRAGMAYAAHILRHSIGEAHGGDPEHLKKIAAEMDMGPCCQEAILSFGLGMAEGMEETAGTVNPDHEHEEVTA